MYKTRIIALIGFLLLLFLFRPLFNSVSLSQGDAPFFSDYFLNDLSKEPSLWTSRGNTFGGQNMFIFNSPYLLLISLFNMLFGVGSAVLIRLFFYIPALFLGLCGMYLVTKKLTTSVGTALVASLLYIANTYLLTIVDGGQVGIVLSYGLFPIVFYAVTSFFEKKTTLVSFTITLICFQLLTFADPRVALVCFTFAAIWSRAYIRQLCYFLLVWVGINMYWIYPLVETGGSSITSSNLPQTASLLNGLFLFAPSWPSNLFGYTTYPYWYFGLFPLLFLIAVKTGKRWAAKAFGLLLICIFLVKGSTPPVGEIYELLTSLPLGSAFRDSTKFFIPLLFLGSLLVAHAVTYLQLKMPRYPIMFAFVAYIAFLLHPALLGKMNFVLSNQEARSGIEYVNNTIYQNNLNRVAWIFEPDARAASGGDFEALAGRELVNFRPFARLNVGSGDKMNFIQNPQSTDWLRIFGVEGLVLNGNPRAKTMSDQEVVEWNNLNQAVKTNGNFEKLQELPVDTYQVKDPLTQQLVGFKRLAVVVGSDNIYESVTNFGTTLQESNFAFVEDGKWNVADLLHYTSDSLFFIEENRDPEALGMSLLKSHFVDLSLASNNSFSNWSTQDYLKYKYELLIRNFIFDDFDYNLGISFSEKPEESIVDHLSVEKEGDYVFAIRAAGRGEVEMTVGNLTETILLSDRLRWTVAPLSLKKGSTNLKITNKSELAVINTVALIPKSVYLEAQTSTKALFEKHQHYPKDKVPVGVFDDNRKELDTVKVNESFYRVTAPEEIAWILFSTAYHPDWVLGRDSLEYKSIPIYSAVNGFYKRPEWSSVTIYFKGQKTLRWGMYVSAITCLIILILGLYKFSKTKNG